MTHAMFRRRRSPVLKLILGASVIYFVIFVFLGRQSVVEDWTADLRVSQRDTAGGGSLMNLAATADYAAAGDSQQPMLERLDLDRIRFQEAMHRDAERAEQRKKRFEEEKRHHEEDRRRRAADRIIPPFRNAFDTVAYSQTQLTAHKAAMSKMLPLITSGDVVVRWIMRRKSPP